MFAGILKKSTWRYEHSRVISGLILAWYERIYLDFAVWTLQNLRLNAKSSWRPPRDDNSNKTSINYRCKFCTRNFLPSAYTLIVFQLQNPISRRVCSVLVANRMSLLTYVASYYIFDLEGLLFKLHQQTTVIVFMSAQISANSTKPLLGLQWYIFITQSLLQCHPAR